MVQFPTPDGHGRYAGVVRDVGADWLVSTSTTRWPVQPLRFEVQLIGVL